MTIASMVVIFALTAALLIQSLSRRNKKRVVVGRRGTVKVLNKWYEAYQGHQEDEVIVVVREIDKVANTSQVQIIEIQAKDSHSSKMARNFVGKWIDTNKVVWDKSEHDHFVVPERHMKVPEHKVLSADERVDIILKEDIKNL